MNFPDYRADSPPGGPADDWTVGASDEEAPPSNDWWDLESWSGAEQVMLKLVALGAPVVLWFTLLDRLPAAWVDWAELLILDLGDLMTAAIFMLVYGSARALLGLLLEGRPSSDEAGKHRRPHHNSVSKP